MSLKGSLSKQEVEAVVRLIKEHGGVSYSLRDLRRAIPEFVRNNTYVILNDKTTGLAAVCLWNVNGTIAEVEEVVIHPRYREMGLLKYIATIGWHKFPFLKYIKFCRERKYEDRSPRVIALQKFIGGSHNGKKARSPRTATCS